MDRVIALSDERWRQLYLLMRFTGLRLSQVGGLQWEDFHDGSLTLRPELGKSEQEKRGRVIPVSQHLQSEMGKWDRSSPPGKGYILSRGSIATRTNRLWSKTGVRDEKWKGRPHHAFRKGFVSGLVLAGANREAVRYLVGHSQGLDGVYTDPASLPLRETVELIPAYPQCTQLKV